MWLSYPQAAVRLRARNRSRCGGLFCPFGAFRAAAARRQSSAYPPISFSKSSQHLLCLGAVRLSRLRVRRTDPARPPSRIAHTWRPPLPLQSCTMIVSVRRRAYAPNAAPKVPARAAVRCTIATARQPVATAEAPEGMGREVHRRAAQAAVGVRRRLRRTARRVGALGPAWPRQALQGVGEQPRPGVAARGGAEARAHRDARLPRHHRDGGGTVHFPAPMFEKAAAAGWPTALQTINENGDDGASIFGQMVATCALIEGASSKGRWDLWFGERPGGVVAGDARLRPAEAASGGQGGRRQDAPRAQERPPRDAGGDGHLHGYLNTGNANLSGRRELGGLVERRYTNITERLAQERVCEAAHDAGAAQARSWQLLAELAAPT